MDALKINQQKILELQNSCSNGEESMKRRKKYNICDEDLIKMRRRRKRKLNESSSEPMNYLAMSRKILRLNVYLYCLSIATVLLNVECIYCQRLTFTSEKEESSENAAGKFYEIR